MKPGCFRIEFFKGIPLLCFLLALPLFLGACAGETRRSQAAQRELLWPPLPMEPRIQWVKEIHDYSDAGITKGFWKRLVDLVAGDNDTKIGKPYGLLVDDQDRLFVVDVGFGVVHLMDLKNKSYSIIGEGKEAVFRTPIAIAEDDDENVYITDAGNGAVFRYGLRDKSMQQFTAVKLERPTGIAFNRNNKLLYVTDTGRHQVVVFDLKGRERLRIGGRGEAPGQFNYPTDLFIDSQGRLFVTDVINARIQIFSANGAFLKMFGQVGNSAGRFAKPKGVAVDADGDIYVCDALLDSVQIFDDTGRLLLDFGGTGTEAGQFWMPAGIFIDKNNYVYVADSYNRRVQVFKYLRIAEARTGDKKIEIKK
jgi:sugar lactone lactonase YvrE